MMSYDPFLWQEVLKANGGHRAGETWTLPRGGIKEPIWGSKVNQHGEMWKQTQRGNLVQVLMRVEDLGETGKSRKRGAVWLDLQKHAPLCPVGRRAMGGRQGRVG